MDKNAAECAIRPFCTKRKSAQHFGSVEGTKMSAVYHSIVSTVRLENRSA